MDFKKQIKDKGLKQSFLAKKMGVSTAYLSSCLNGRFEFTTFRSNQLKQLLK